MKRNFLSTIGLILLGAVWLFPQSAALTQPRQPSQGSQAPQLLNASLSSAKDVAVVKPARDWSKLGSLQQQLFLSAQRGGDWLYRVNGTDGRFVSGYVTSLRTILEGDHFYRQVDAAIALSRAARFTSDERYAARARQALLTLLADTAAENGLRSTTLPPPLVNRLAAAGMLLQAIGELPAPAEDMLAQAEQLSAFLRSRQQSNGSFQYLDSADTSATPLDIDGMNYCPGQALHGLTMSQRLRPADWKLDACRRALAYYLPWWRERKNPMFVASQTAAYSEAYLLTGEKPFAEAVYELCDWICELQYPLLDPRHPLWGGGFRGWVDGRPATTAPGVGSAVFAESLAAASRVARKSGDVARYQRYRDALERTLQFLAGLQFTDASTQHFADWYRPYLIGAFFESHQDGSVRVDHTAHAVSAMIGYLAHVVE